jgi:hypothetical protein
MLRAQFIADLLVKAATGLKKAIRLATQPIQRWLAKPKSQAG